MILPILHSNGTSKQELLDLRNAVHMALQEAEKFLKRMAPNGRDYYPQPGLFEQAIEQHRRRQSALVALTDELEAEIIAIDREGRP